jgi:hypothetical protein
MPAARAQCAAKTNPTLRGALPRASLCIPTSRADGARRVSGALVREAREDVRRDGGRRITVHSRAEGAPWMTRVAISEGSVAVETLGLELRVDDVYRGSSIR